MSRTLPVPNAPLSGTLRSGRQALFRRGILTLFSALLLGFALSYISLVRSGDAGAKKSDFVPYYSAAHLVITGHGSDVYDLQTMGRFERHLVRPLRVRDGVMPYLYPAYFAALIAPLAALPYGWAFGVWFLVNCVLLGCALLILQRAARLRGEEAACLWLGGISFLPTLLALSQGQTSILLLALYSVALCSLATGSQTVAGVAIAGALIKPQYVAPLLLVLVLQRKWRALSAFAVTGAALIGLPALAFGPRSLSGFLDTATQAAGWTHQIGGFAPRWNQSFAGFSQLLIPDSHVASAAGLAAALVALAALARFTLRVHSTVAAAAASVIVALLISPHVLLHDLTVLLVPGALAVTFHRPDDGLGGVLAFGYAGVIAGLVLVTVAPIQISVIAMTGLLLWYLQRESYLGVRPPAQLS